MRHLQKFLLVSAVALPIVMAGCLGMKPKTALDVAREAASVFCELWAAEQPADLVKLGPKDFCAVEKNLEPFMDGVLAAKRTAGDEMTMKLKRPANDAH